MKILIWTFVIVWFIFGEISIVQQINNWVDHYVLKNCEWENEWSMAQCKLGMCEIEKKYRDKKRRLMKKYYGTDDFDLAEKQIGRIPEIDKQFLWG